MNYGLIILDEIYIEIENAACYYNDLQEGLGLKLVSRWEESVAIIIRNPFAYQKHKKQYRLVQISDFPFVIVYEVTEKDIIIYRFIHSKKNPVKRFRLLRRKK